MNNDNFQTTKKERLTYGIYFCGQNIMWGFAGLISTYLLDIGLDAKLASAILLFPKVWDAVNDTLFGYVVDKVKLKKNETFMPWVRIGTAMVGIFVLIIFAIPASASTTLKVIWFLLGYLFFDVAYTFLDAPMYAMPTCMTTNIYERTKLVSSNRFWGIFGGIVGSLSIPIIRPKTGWFVGSIIYVVLGLVLMIPFCLIGKERTTKTSEESQQSYSFKEMFNYVKGNKYLLISLLILFVVGACSIESSLALIMARNCLGDEAKATLITIIPALLMVVLALSVPSLNKKFDKYYILLTGMIVSLVSSIALYFVGYENILLFMILMTLKAVGGSTYLIIVYMMIADSVEYGTYKLNTRAPGISFSLQTFVSKLKNAVIGSLSLFLLGLCHYDSSLPETVIQAPNVVKGIWGLFNLVPAIGFAFAIIMLVGFYKLKDKDVEIMAKANNNEISKEEAEKLLTNKF